MSFAEQPDKPFYDPKVIEPKWQRYWLEHDTFKAVRRPGREKLYVLDMFPYPSGAGLHVGHPEGYTATDIVARHARMLGKDVLHPMGWDAFGLPAEQYAIQTGTHPGVTTAKNIATFKRQLQSLGFSYDWSREIDTTDAEYVKWTQWIFLKLFEKGLAYEDRIPVNWCAELGTVLANEEVIDGKSERGGFPVERVPLRQWMLRITQYADRLDSELTGLDWPETREKQRHWIGRSEGAEINFQVLEEAGKAPATITVFTTRVDTLPGATYVVVAPEHPLLPLLTSGAQQAEVSAYVDAAKNRSDRDRGDFSKAKTGVFTGASVQNPLTGRSIPVWVADYVLGSYGTGAVMAVPAHDERDHAFAKAYSLPIEQVVARADGKPVDVQAEAYSDYGVAHGIAAVGVADGTPTAATKTQLLALLTERGAGKGRVTTRLRDWVFSRQRYWGEPIPVYFPVDLEEGVDPRTEGAKYTVRYGEAIPVDVSELPLRLPDLEDFKPSTDPEGPLARAKDWRFFQRDGKWFARETNTMPQWAGSCWYYLRFVDPHNAAEFASEQAQKDWLPVDLYVGGSEHAVLHLLYARFWHKVLYDAGLVHTAEPFTKLVHQGMILGEDAQKMSKSRGNVINPDDVIQHQGADALRLYEMFMGPLEAVKPWQTNGVEGVRRFLERVFAACSNVTDEPAAYDAATRKIVHRTIAKVGGDIEGMRFNTAISAMMILVKHFLAMPAVPRPAAQTLLLLLAPFAPHLAEELWEQLGGTQSLACEPWPTFDPAELVDDEVEIGVQVNGKVRSTVLLPKDADEATARALALDDAKVKSHVDGKTVKKVIYVAGRILNFIVA